MTTESRYNEEKKFVTIYAQVLERAQEILDRHLPPALREQLDLYLAQGPTFVLGMLHQTLGAVEAELSHGEEDDVVVAHVAEKVAMPPVALAAVWESLGVVDRHKVRRIAVYLLFLRRKMLLLE